MRGPPGLCCQACGVWGGKLGSTQWQSTMTGAPQAVGGHPRGRLLCGAGDGWARAAGAPCRAWPSSHVLGLPAETRPETTGSARGPTRCLQPAAASGRRSAVAGAGLHPGERASACVGRPWAPGWIPSTPDLAAQAGQQPPLAGSPSSLQGQPWAAGNDPWVKLRPERHLDSDATVSLGSGPRHPHAQLCTRQRVFFPKLGQTD